MKAEIQEFVLHHHLIDPGDRIVAGVSGGADSVALLVILHELRDALNFSLFACHLNHCLRGSAGDEDEAYVRQLAEKLGVPCYVGRKDVAAIQHQTGGSLEEAARRVRYEFFEEAATEFHAVRVALGHHRDDQCETIVFNLIRGSGIHGLRGMPVRRPIRPAGGVQIIRPLLTVSKAEIEIFLRRRGIDWRRDHTNELPTVSRNVIRHRILPAMEQISASVRERLLELARQAGAMEAILDEPVRRILAAARRQQNEIRIEQWRLESLPEMVAGEVVRGMLMELGVGIGPLTAQHYRKLAALKTRLDLPGGWRARVEHGWLILGPRTAADENAGEQRLTVGETCRFGTRTIRADLREFEARAFAQFLAGKTRFEEWLDAAAIAGELTVRHARDGERFHPLGSPGRKKVGDFLTDVKAGWSARPAVVVADEKGIVWLVGWRIDERVKTSVATQRVIVLTVGGL